MWGFVMRWGAGRWGWGMDGCELVGDCGVMDEG